MQTFAGAMNRPAFLALGETMVNLFGKERAVLLTTGAKIKPEAPVLLGFTYKYPTIADACKQLVGKE